MIRILTGFPAWVWGVIAGIGSLVLAGIKLVALTNQKRDLEQKEAENETRDRMDKVKPAVDADSARKLLRGRAGMD